MPYVLLFSKVAFLQGAILDKGAKMDKSLKRLKVVHETKGKSEINQSFDEDIKALAKKYGLVWHGQGIELETGKRDLVFNND